MEKRVKIEGAFGKSEGIEVDITNSNERVSELTLEDGTILKIKPSIIRVIRLDGHWDPEGNPLYNVTGQFTVLISEIPERLKKGGQ